MSLLLGASPAQAIPEEAWIKYDQAGAGAQGSGTPASPYLVNATYPFDRHMLNLTQGANPEAKDIRVLPGTYAVTGKYGGVAWNLRANQRLLGAGRGATVLNFVPASGVSVVVTGVGDMIEVADLSVKANVLSSARTGVKLTGSYCTIRNVEALGVGGITSGIRGVGCEIASPSSYDSIGNRILDCKVQVSGSAGAGIEFAGNSANDRWITGTILNNRVTMPSGANGYYGICFKQASDIDVGGQLHDRRGGGLQAYRRRVARCHGES